MGDERNTRGPPHPNALLLAAVDLSTYCMALSSGNFALSLSFLDAESVHTVQNGHTVLGMACAKRWCAGWRFLPHCACAQKEVGSRSTVHNSEYCTNCIIVRVVASHSSHVTGVRGEVGEGFGNTLVPREGRQGRPPPRAQGARRRRRSPTRPPHGRRPRRVRDASVRKSSRGRKSCGKTWYLYTSQLRRHPSASPVCRAAAMEASYFCGRVPFTTCTCTCTGTPFVPCAHNRSQKTWMAASRTQWQFGTS